MEKFIRLKILANGRYCNDECGCLITDESQCRLFGVLSWHYKKKTNGYMRPLECRKAEKDLEN
jgi:hypothetical protein